MKKIISILTFFLIISLSVPAQQQAKTDTTKQQPPTYLYLIGTVQNFQLLFTAVSTPGDVTPNQLKALSEWVLKGTQPLPTDSTGNKPKK